MLNEEVVISNDIPSNAIQEKKQYNAPQLIFSAQLPESGSAVGAEAHVGASTNFQPS